MENNGIESLINLVNRIEITDENKQQVNQMKKLIKQEKYVDTITILNELKNEGKIKLKNMSIMDIMKNEDNKIDDDFGLFNEEFIEEEENEKDDTSDTTQNG